MNTKELREFIDGLPDDATVMIELDKVVFITIGEAEYLPQLKRVVLHLMKPTKGLQ